MVFKSCAWHACEITSIPKMDRIFLIVVLEFGTKIEDFTQSCKELVLMNFLLLFATLHKIHSEFIFSPTICKISFSIFSTEACNALPFFSTSST